MTHSNSISGNMYRSELNWKALMLSVIVYFFFGGLGRVFMYLAMIDSITSSAPPPIDNNLKSLYDKMTHSNSISGNMYRSEQTMKFNNAKRSIPAHPTFINDALCDLNL